MHTTKEILAEIDRLNPEELNQVQQAIDERRKQLGYGPVSTVEERRNYRNGILQRERRAYRRKDGGLTERGPYWYFHYREGGRQRTLYLGKSDDPESELEARRHG